MLDRRLAGLGRPEGKGGAGEARKSPYEQGRAKVEMRTTGESGDKPG